MNGPETAERVEDLALVQRTRTAGGTSEAIAALFERFGQETYAFFRRRVGDADLAAELNQDLYLAALQGLGRFRRRSSLRTWLFGIAHHRLSHLRSRWRIHLDEVTGTVPERIWQQLAAEDEGGPEASAVRAERTLALRRCLARLSELHRAVVLGQYYEGRTLAELTRRLDLTNPSGARAPLIAALRLLRRCLERAGVLGDRGRAAPGGGS
jgi:RNA polymerase sigma-70 factor (ECF subfamily)